MKARTHIYIYMLLLVLVLGAELLIHPHPMFNIDDMIFFHAFLGFITSILLIGLTRCLASILKRPEHYYDRKHDDC